jgi:hypothetical protein
MRNRISFTAGCFFHDMVRIRGLHGGIFVHGLQAAGFARRKRLPLVCLFRMGRLMPLPPAAARSAAPSAFGGTDAGFIFRFLRLRLRHGWLIFRRFGIGCAFGDRSIGFRRG